METKKLDKGLPASRIDDRVRMGMGVLPPAERAVVQTVITSPERLLKLPKTTRVIGGEKHFVAAVSPRLRVVFRLEAGGVEVVDLVNTKVFRTDAKRGGGTAKSNRYRLGRPSASGKVGTIMFDKLKRKKRPGGSTPKPGEVVG
jgi:hypothetical protein